MTTLSRKQREIQEREGKILEVAREMLLRDGYLGLSMDRIAEAVEYGKGTVYRHFPNKEDIILALAVQTQKKRTSLFQRASLFRGKSRERLTAVAVAGELFVRLYPDHFHVEQVVRLSSIWEKTSEKRQEILRTCEHACTGIVAGIVRDAVAQGDLTLPGKLTPEDIVFGLWSISFGSYTLMSTSNSLLDVGINDPALVIRDCIHQMLDGFGWKALSTQHDYEAVFQKALKETFADEYEQLLALR
ncbi:TetR/AcrR family transcriptional regulator [Bremerella cremea]|uniref:TetR/AcrR family transcriptional regulator n=1 Tax=Bremerella cremea TaxID=1031537 RepID=A0A368KUW5_9BACT|nr:TetR/AcrR family transcriptional regulator [Bremerella cremea]RCS54121.1 TetR/AcrR family transcriptional regulator [Bremerella cremea]